MRSRGIAVVLVTFALSAGLTGCDSGLTQVTCVSWVTFETAQSMFDEATLVVEGEIGPELGRLDFLAGPVTGHEISVDRVHKGELESSTIIAASPRDYCTENPPQPSPDPLAEGERVLLFLRANGTSWVTLNPEQGIVQFPEGTELPFTAS